MSVKDRSLDPYRLPEPGTPLVWTRPTAKPPRSLVTMGHASGVGSRFGWGVLVLIVDHLGVQRRVEVRSLRIATANDLLVLDPDGSG